MVTANVSTTMKTISVTDEIHAELLKIAAEIQQRTGKRIDIATAIQELLAGRQGKKH